MHWLVHSGVRVVCRLGHWGCPTLPTAWIMGHKQVNKLCTGSARRVHKWEPLIHLQPWMHTTCALPWPLYSLNPIHPVGKLNNSSIPCTPTQILYNSRTIHVRTINGTCIQLYITHPSRQTLKLHIYMYVNTRCYGNLHFLHQALKC